MSVVNMPPGSDDSEDIEVPSIVEQIFPKLIARNNLVCSHCYRRLRRQEPFPLEAGMKYGDILAAVEYDIPRDADQHDPRSWDYHEVVRLSQRYRNTFVSASRIECGHCGGMGNIFLEEETPEGRTVERVSECDRCGGAGQLTDLGGSTARCWNCDTCSPWYRESDATRSKANAVEAACSISVTLHEYGIDHDWLHLVTKVQQLKSQPKTAGNDFEVFKFAVEQAVYRAQHFHTEQ